MIVAVDIDGILTNETEGHDYAARSPNVGAIKLLRVLCSLPGVEVYLFTSRYDCDRAVTLEWLQKHGAPGGLAIRFDKPRYDFLVDDRAV